MATAPTQQATGSGAGSSTTTVVTLGAAPARGSTLFAFFGNSQNTIAISGIASTNCTWAKVVQANANSDVEIWKGVVSGTATPGTVVTITHTILVTTSQAQVSEWPGVWVTETSGPPNGTSANPATGTITLTAGRDALLLAMTRKGGTFTSGPTNSWVALTTGSTGTQYAYLAVGVSASSYAGTDWTYSTSTAWDVAFGVFVQQIPADGWMLNQAVNRAGTY